MFAKYMTAGVVGSALLASVAFAQNPTPSGQTPPAQTPAPTSSSTAQATMPESSLKGNWRASKVVGLYVYNNNNENIGSINELLMDKSGNIKAVVIGVGGFLGMGEHLVAVAFDKIKFSDQPVAQSSASSSTSRPANSTAPTSTTTGAASSTSSSSKNEWYPDHAVFNASKDELKALPEFKFNS